MVDLAILEYGVGNLGSVLHACRRAGCEPSIVSNRSELEGMSPSHILLPGVGAIGEALFHLRSRDLEAPLLNFAQQEKVPILAICVGMQMLAESCNEFGDHRGLGLIPGATTARIAKKGSGVRLPHMGWNDIDVDGDHGGLLRGLEAEHFYFLHSFAMTCCPENLLASTDYHGSITAAVRNRNVFGVQFHPEKSNQAGARLIANFFALGSG